jgi:hypothetical protein
MQKKILLLAEPVLAFFVWIGDDVMRIISLVIMAIVGWYAIQAHRSTKRKNEKEAEYYDQKTAEYLENKKSKKP